MYTSKISMVKAILDLFTELKDSNITLDNSKKILTKEIDAPSKTHSM